MLSVTPYTLPVMSYVLPVTWVRDTQYVIRSTWYMVHGISYTLRLTWVRWYELLGTCHVDSFQLPISRNFPVKLNISLLNAETLKLAMSRK